MNEKEFASRIDHTLLGATTTSEQVKRLCQEARACGFYSVCVNSRWTDLAADELHGSQIKVSTVVAFPLGADSTKIKISSIKEAIFSGADEIDMVADLAAIIEGDWKYLTGQFRAAMKVCRSMKPPVVLKIIIESAALSMEQKMTACQIAENCGVDFIKTSTGMHHLGGATIEDIKLIRSIAPRCKVKASGGIRTARAAIAMLEAGADRIGTSSSMEIMNQFRTESSQ